MVDTGASASNAGSSAGLRRRGLRTGYTTGACATAAAAAATRALLTNAPVEFAIICLPSGVEVRFEVAACERSPREVRCSVLKDGGDDPDVTHGAEIAATVRYSEMCGVDLRGGEGVGVVTLAGLGLAVGGPAINPVPRRMIVQSVEAELARAGYSGGIAVEISVPRGEELARRTLNPRLGILGGISILGTTGIVRPYSTAAWRASVEQAIDVAAANGCYEIAITTGGRSERFAQATLGLPEVALVEMGEFTGHALRRCARDHIERVYVCGMIGKLSKIAQGHLMTHVAGNQVDPAFLARLAAEAGAGAEAQRTMASATTARAVQEIAQARGLLGCFDIVAGRAAASCSQAVNGRLAVECLLFDFDGVLLARAVRGSRAGQTGG
jgi:cobalt-precorrin-5B (C1)-methyltransferase